MNKKLMALILAAIVVVMSFAFVACNGGEDTTDPSESTEGTQTYSDLAYVTEKGKLIIGMTDYAPMNFKDENDEWTGFDTEFAQLVGKELGVEVEFLEIDWGSKFTELDGKGIDLIWNGMTITEEVELNSSVTAPYVVNAQVVVMAADKLADYADADSMKDLTFAVEDGSAGQAEAETAGFTNVTAVVSQSDALLEVSSGAADACIIDITMANAMTGEGTSYANLSYDVELSVEEYGIAGRKDSDLVEKIDELMATYKQDGTLKELADKYDLTIAE